MAAARANERAAEIGKRGEGANVIARAAGLVSLLACNSSPREQAADNIESDTEAVADNLEDAADNVSNDAAEARLENKADAVRATGQNQADDMRTNDPDMNLSNGIEFHETEQAAPKHNAYWKGA